MKTKLQGRARGVRRDRGKREKIEGREKKENRNN